LKAKFSVALALAASFVLPVSAFAQKKPHIIVVTHGQVSDSFWLVVKNGVEQAAKDSGSEVEYRAPEKFDKKLGCLMHVGQEEYVAGKGAGERMKAQGVTKAVCINQEVGNAGLDARAKGFKDGLGGDVEILAVGMDFTQSRNAFAGYLQKNPNIEGILALGPTGSEPALQALQQAGKVGKVKFGTFDLSPTVLQALDKKEMDFAIDQQQFLQGYLPVIFLSNYIKYGLLIATNSIPTGPGFVTPENAKQVIELSKKGIR
jgi:simple sugar transport system substrate-binding protein